MKTKKTENENENENEKKTRKRNCPFRNLILSPPPNNVVEQFPFRDILLFNHTFTFTRSRTKKNILVVHSDIIVGC
jgi:hypothetical protein